MSEQVDHAAKLEAIAREHVLAGHLSEPSADPPCGCLYCREARDMRAAAAELRRLRELNHALVHQLERRADGMDPLTQDLRAAKDAAERENVRLREVLEGIVSRSDPISMAYKTARTALAPLARGEQE